MPAPTSETITFLFSDVEGSTGPVRQLGHGYPAVQARHAEILRSAFAERGGQEVDTQGDAFFVAFRRPRDAMLAAVEAQRRLGAEPWPDGGSVRVRMGIHTAPGRLTLEEFAERMERAYAARTVTELESVGRDLPATPAAESRRRPKRLTAALLANTVRTGRWRMPRFGLGFVLFGDLDLDLRQAELRQSTASLTVLMLFGNVDVYVPEGVEIDFGGLGVFGHQRQWGRDVPPLPGTPL